MSTITSPSWRRRRRIFSAGRKVWTEGAGGLGIDGKYQLDFQLVRGVNALQISVPVMQRGGPGNAAAAGPAPCRPEAPMLAWYTNRAGYLMAIGRPAAQVGLYHPVNSLWMGDEAADRSTTKLGWQLLEHQVDWDYFDEQSLSSVATIEDGGFKNLSGQVYRAIVVPSTTVISRTGLERLQAFVESGRQGDFRGQDAVAGGRQDVSECKGYARSELCHADRAFGRHHAARAGGAAPTGCEAGLGVPATDLYAPQLARCRHVLLLQREQQGGIARGDARRTWHRRRHGTWRRAKFIPWRGVGAEADSVPFR
jgi:hypothetical protein